MEPASQKTAITLGIIASIQACIIAAMSAGWHPWEEDNSAPAERTDVISEPTPDDAGANAPVATPAAKGTTVSPPLVGTGAAELRPGTFEGGNYTIELCKADATAVMVAMEFENIRVRTQMVSGEYGSTAVAVECYYIKYDEINIIVSGAASDEVSSLLDKVRAGMVGKFNDRSIAPTT